MRADVEFTVTIKTKAPLADLSAAEHAALQRLMDAARDAAMDVLAGPPDAPADPDHPQAGHRP